MASLQKKEKILLGIAGLIAIYFVINQFFCGDKGQQPPKLAKKTVARKTIFKSSGESKTKGIQPKKAIQEIANSNRIEYKSWGRNPFLGAIRLAEFDETGSDSSNFVLKGVIWKGDEAQVLIGDEILREGDRAGDLEILEIEKNRVVCKKGMTIVTLVLKEDDIIP